MKRSYATLGASGDASFESDLRAWLRGNDLGPLSEAARVRTFRDLERLSGERPDSVRDAWPVRGLAAAALLLVVLAAALAFLGPGSFVDTIGASAAPAVPSPAPTGDVIGVEPDWSAFLGLLTVSALVGLLAFAPGVRGAFTRWLFGRSPEDDSRILPIRLRPMPRLALAMGTLAVVEIGLSMLLLASQRPIGPGVVSLLVLGPALLFQSLSVPIRYRMDVRSSRLLVAYLAIPLCASIVQLLALISDGQASASLQLAGAALELFAFLAPVALAAGLARRSRLIVRPPLALAALLIAVVIALRLAPYAPNVQWMAPEWIIFDTVAVVLFSLGDVALLAGAWVCFSTARVVRHWVPWAAAAVGCVSLLAEMLPLRLEHLLLVVAPDVANTQQVFDLAGWWRSLTYLVALSTLAFAFIAGLSRAEPHRELWPNNENEGDEPEEAGDQDEEKQVTEAADRPG